MYVLLINHLLLYGVRTRLNSLWCEWAKFMYEAKLARVRARRLATNVRPPFRCCFFSFLSFEREKVDEF